MRTLPSNVANSYMKRGKKPRVFVEIPDLEMFLGTAAETIDGNAFENKLNPCGTITWDAPLFSGMGSISNVTIKNLEIGRDISLCEKAEIVPQGDGETGKAGSGRLVSDDYGDYADIRKAATGNFDTVSVIVGRRRYGGAPLCGYSVYRAFLQFKIPAGLTSCEEAALFLSGLGNYSDTDFELYVLKGNWTLYNTGDMFNDFDGWSDTEGAYNGTVLNEKFTSYGYSSTETNRIIFNRDGRKWIEENAGGTLRLMIISKNDYLGNTASDPSGDEYLMLEASSARLKINYNTKNLTNATAKVYLAYDPVPSSTDEMFLRWTGVVDKWKVNEKTIDLELKQDNRKQDVLIPENVITKGDYPHIDDSSIGKPIPIVYGDFMGTLRHKGGVGYCCKEGTSNYFGFGDYVKCYIYENDADMTYKYALTAGHLLKEIDHAGYIYESELKTFAFIAGDLSDVSADGLAKVKIISGDYSKFPYNLVKHTPYATSLNPVICKIPANVVDAFGENAGYCIDADISNYTTLEEWQGMWGHGTYYYGHDWGVQALFTPFAVVFITNCDGSYEFEKIGLNTFVTQPDGGDHWEYASLDGQHYHTSIYAHELRKISSNFASTNEDDVKILSLFICRGYKKDINTEMFIRCKGRYDDASGTITGTTDELFENPSHIVESIARDEMSFGAENIDTGAFDDSAELLDNWKFAFQLLERKETMKLFGEIGEQSKSRIMFDEQNRLSVLTFKEDRGFPNAGTNTPEIPGDLDIFDEDEKSTDGAFTKHPIKPLLLTVEPIDLKEVKNNFKLYYKFNYASGEFEKILFINHGNGVKDDVAHNITESYLENDQTLSETGGLKELTSGCYNEIGATNTRIIRAWAIRDEATATKLLQYEVERRTRQLLICNFTTWENAVAHETGDYINIRHNRILNLRNEAWMKAQKWEILRLRHDQDRNTIGVKVIEV